MMNPGILMASALSLRGFMRPMHYKGPALKTGNRKQRRINAMARKARKITRRNLK